MAEPRQRSSSLLLSAIGGAVLGAAGLGWWLLSEADRRRQRRQPEQWRFSEPLGDEGFAAAAPEAIAAPASAPLGDNRLQEKVQRLNKAIDEVRRQLEQLQPLP
jgi:uncharacterized iron-regulated membrane protein